MRARFCAIKRKDVSYLLKCVCSMRHSVFVFACLCDGDAAGDCEL